MSAYFAATLARQQALRALWEESLMRFVQMRLHTPPHFLPSLEASIQEASLMLEEIDEQLCLMTNLTQAYA